MSHPSRTPAARSDPSGPPTVPGSKRASRPRLQFSVLGLLVLMLFGSMVGAIAFYFVRGWQSGVQSDKLVGMVFVLAGPLLLTIVVSLMVAIVQRLSRK